MCYLTATPGREGEPSSPGASGPPWQPGSERHRHPTDRPYRAPTRTRHDGPVITRAAVTVVTLALAAASLTACSQDPPTECELAFEEAASVPLAQTNDVEMHQTVKRCGLGEWLDGLDDYPDAIGLTNLSATEKFDILQLLCPSHAPGSAPACDEAREAGLLG